MSGRRRARRHYGLSSCRSLVGYYFGCDLSITKFAEARTVGSVRQDFLDTRPSLRKPHSFPAIEVIAASPATSVPAAPAGLERTDALRSRPSRR